MARSAPMLRLFAVCFVAISSAPIARAQATQPTTRRFSIPLTVIVVAQWSDERLSSEQGRQIVENILTWQNPNGGWWKGYNLTTARPATAPSTQPKANASTIDNGATHSELRILAHAYRLWPKPEYRAAFDRGLSLLLQTQYPNGGWPQQFPLNDNYGTHITFNDDGMVSVLRLLREVSQGQGHFTLVDEATRQKAKQECDRGIECILNCQIKVNGKLTAWCAQHDETTFEPAKARSYELPSISGWESAGIVLFLMDTPDPSDRVRQSVQAAASWFERSKILGKRMRTMPDPNGPGGRDRKIVDDPEAPPQWARFYDIETNRPFYCGRDGIKRWSLAEIDADRRNNYQWMRPWGQPVLDRYPEWAAKNKLPTTLPAE